MVAASLPDLSCHKILMTNTENMVLLNHACISEHVLSSCSEIDKNLDQMANMRKDKIIMEGKIKK